MKVRWVKYLFLADARRALSRGLKSDGHGRQTLFKPQ
jgi:hypothetical protein